MSTIACTGDRKPGPDVVGPTAKFPDPTEGSKPKAAPLRDEIPPSEAEAVMGAHLRGVGNMEQFEYSEAARAFREVHERAPGWITGSINLAIALLNDKGKQAESAGGRVGQDSFEEALALLNDVIARAPDNLHARYSRGLILEYVGRIADAHRDFLFVSERDPNDAHVWLKVGSTLGDPNDADKPAGLKQADQLLAIYTKAYQLNPYLVPNLYKLQATYGWAGRRDKQSELLKTFQRLNPELNIAGTGETSSSYGLMGKYATIINPISVLKCAEEPGIPPRFDSPRPIEVALPSGHRWVTRDDFEGPLAPIGRARDRFGAAVGSFDVNGDGRTDLYLAAAVRGPKGVRDALLVNLGGGKFEDATARFGLPEDCASLGLAAADFDADRRIDVYVTGLSGNRLYRNTGKRFEDVTETAKVAAAGAIGLTASWLDIDQDGDLDLYVLNGTTSDHVDEFLAAGKDVPGAKNSVFRNDGRPPALPGKAKAVDTLAPAAVSGEDGSTATSGLSIAFTEWQDDALRGDASRHTAIAALDVDDDRDMDLVLSADGEPLRVILNDRLGHFHATTLSEPKTESPISGLLSTDLDKDGRTDLVATSASGPVAAWRNAARRTSNGPQLGFEPWPTDARRWRAATAADLDLDSWADLLGLPASAESPGPEWARNDGRRLASAPLPVAPDPEVARPLCGVSLADVDGDPLPDLVIVRSGVGPILYKNLGNGHHWLALELSGRWHVQPEHMRSNPHGLGARVALHGQGLNAFFENTTPQSGLAQSVGPIVMGMGKIPTTALVRLRWPDGTMQSELNVTGDRLHAIAEHNRKTGSCPVLFTWNGERFVCLGDFLGGGGLGYLVAPGVYSQPDRDEAMAISAEQLRVDRGVYRLSVTEPMDEVAYLDRLTLDVVDSPPGVSLTVDERFAPAPKGPRPTGEVLAWRTTIEPLRATDLKGRDVTSALRAFDRTTVDSFARRVGWIGYAEEHGIVLDFGDRLSGFGPDDPLVLCLAGWVEYPYSQTNYAAATAGVTLDPPKLERRRADGTWETIEPNAGYPAGLPRMTTLDLTGKLTGRTCALRLRTNMECYWDQAFIALRDRSAAVKVTSLPMARAVLGDRGYTREASSDGKLPLLYDYNHVDPAPLARMSGLLTRYGDVAELLHDDDDHLCVLGPGDEVRLEFDAASAPVLPEGWTRSYVLRSVGYCKDADPFTAASDDVGPLPWKAMPVYPFGREGERPRDSAYERYLREYQTRPAGAP